MKSNYKKIGQYIRQINNRNKELKVINLLGINIDKFFMPSVANIVGTDMTNYKIVKKGQFACNRMHVGRDMRVPVALSKNDEHFIVSPAYNVFEIIDETELLPEYLMMWFSRKEFDRNAWFYTDADVRQGLHWDAFCDVELPVPDITKQQEIVDEYNAIKNRISLNNSLIQKLEDTAQAIYREWFVDFEFPDKNGNPYKSSGGEMEFCEELEKEVPKGWKIGKVGNFTKIFTGRKNVEESNENGKYRFFSCSPDIFYSDDFLYDGKVILITGNGSFTGRVSYYEGKFDLYQRTYAIVKSEKEEIDLIDYIYFIMKFLFEPKYMGGSRGSSIPYIVIGDISKFEFIIPEKEILVTFKDIAGKIIYFSEKVIKENENLGKIKDLILSKIASES